MADTPKLQVGDEVCVFDVNGNRMGQPDGGWIGKVVKVGRTLVYIEYGARTDKFEIDTGKRPDSYRHRSFKTVQQAADDQLRQAAETSLSDLGVIIEWRVRSQLSADQMEAIAGLVRSFTEEEKTHG